MWFWKIETKFFDFNFENFRVFSYLVYLHIFDIVHEIFHRKYHNVFQKFRKFQNGFYRIMV